ncbi:MAG: alanine/glycine:cation symporter family protein [Kiritimatiellia bacterium]
MGINQILETAAGWAWGPPMLVLLVGTHLFLTVRLRFIQRYLGHAIRISLRRSSEGEGDVSHFGALTTALAATVGTGNIVGVATAVSLGGPGAVLWMWLTGVFGIATKYAEALLSVKYRVKMPDGTMAGGPMYVLERGMNSKPLAVFFAAMTAIAAFGIGNTVQANAVVSLVCETFPDVPAPLLQWGLGLAMAGLTAAAILGGIRSIAKICQILVPFMAGVYVLGCLAILVLHWRAMPSTLATICTTAFTGQAALGGFAGAGLKEAIRYGVARGLFSNESGMGSAPIVAAAAQTTTPVRQALVSATGTFWDTVVICAMTGLVLVSSGHWQEGIGKAALTKAAFADLHAAGPIVLFVGLLTFVFSTILGWSYYGEKAVEYLFGRKAIVPYRYLWVAGVLLGSVVSMQAVWNFADLANALMAFPNLISLIALSPVLVAETKRHLWELKD